jgi:hypothetical protein
MFGSFTNNGRCKIHIAIHNTGKDYAYGSIMNFEAEAYIWAKDGATTSIL